MLADVGIILSTIASSVRDNIEENMKKETYREKWLKAHPQIRLYLSKEEYEALKRIADNKHSSMKDIIMSAIKETVKLTQVMKHGMQLLIYS
jgi:hypothetical protein